MSNRAKLVVVLGAVAAFALVAPGCGPGTTSTSSNSGGSGANGGGGAGGNTGGTGGMTNTGGSTGGSTGGTGGSTGGTGGSTGGSSGDNGAPASAFVNAGGTAKSQNYKMVFTLGQSTQNQSRTTSQNYKMDGGIIGATGSFK